MLNQYPQVKKYIKKAFAVVVILNFALAFFLLNESKKTPKVAHFDMNMVTTSLQSEIQNKISEAFKPQIEALETQIDQYQAKKNEFERTKDRNKSEVRRNEKELAKLEAQIEAKIKSIEKKYGERVNEDMHRRIKDVIPAVDKVYKERGYDMVIFQPMTTCLSSGSPDLAQMIVGDSKNNITKYVLDELGLKEVDVNNKK